MASKPPKLAARSLADHFILRRFPVPGCLTPKGNLFPYALDYGPCSCRDEWRQLMVRVDGMPQFRHDLITGRIVVHAQFLRFPPTHQVAVGSMQPRFVGPCLENGPNDSPVVRICERLCAARPGHSRPKAASDVRVPSL